jgi:hypothetical protein
MPQYKKTFSSLHCLVFKVHFSQASSFYLLTVKVVGLSGLEPPTSRLSGVRSNRLSYKPIPGGDEESRTPDPLLARQVLSQLSYTPSLRLPSPSAAESTGLSKLYSVKVHDRPKSLDVSSNIS